MLIEDLKAEVDAIYEIVVDHGSGPYHFYVNTATGLVTEMVAHIPTKGLLVIEDVFSEYPPIRIAVSRIHDAQDIVSEASRDLALNIEFLVKELGGESTYRAELEKERKRWAE